MLLIHHKLFQSSTDIELLNYFRSKNQFNVNQFNQPKSEFCFIFSLHGI